MKLILPMLLGSALLVGCSDGSDNSPDDAVPPPVEPPVMQSFSDFARQVFADSPNSEPRSVDGMQFVPDAQEDDFADLLQ